MNIQTLKFISKYFTQSNEKLKAWSYLVGAVASTILMTLVFAILPWWFNTFWLALEAQSITMLISSLQSFVALLVGTITIVGLKNYLENNLIIYWRDWLHKHLVNKFIAKQNYLTLSRSSKKYSESKPGFYLQEDIKKFVENSVVLGIEMISNFLSLGYFAISLWVLGGTLPISFFGIHIIIPGYLVWIALSIAGFNSLVTKFISGKLAIISNQKFVAEDSLRQEINNLANHAENIAMQHAEQYYLQRIKKVLNDLTTSAFILTNIKTVLSSFQTFTMQLQQVLPYFVALPALYSGKLNMARFMQLSMSFTQVGYALSWFQYSYQRLVDYRNSANRIMRLEQRFLKVKRDTSPVTQSRINLMAVQGHANVTIKHCSIGYPNKPGYIVKNINFEIQPGEHCLIQGLSGIGKSTLFKVIAGSWKYGSGDVLIPDGKSMCFLTQETIIPHNSLKAVLAYPNDVDQYTNSDFMRVLLKIGGLDAHIPDLDRVQDWSQVFSLGQQQRIAFARALLQKPDWLFMDETTSSLDLFSEDKLYQLLQSELPATTIVSIAHRPSVRKFHRKVVNISGFTQDVYELSSRSSAECVEQGCILEDLGSSSGMTSVLRKPSISIINHSVPDDNGVVPELNRQAVVFSGEVKHQYSHCKYGFDRKEQTRVHNRALSEPIVRSYRFDSAENNKPSSVSIIKGPCSYN